MLISNGRTTNGMGEEELFILLVYKDDYLKNKYISFLRYFSNDNINIYVLL
jgi:hypothetical protein